MSHTTTKWGLIVPDESDTDDVPSWIEQLANDIDVLITGFKADTHANMPTGAAIKDGLLFWDTTNGAFYLGYGGAFHALTGSYGGTSDVTISGFADAASAGTPSKGAAPIDHRHGREANPLPAHLAAGDPHTQYALDTDVAAAIATAGTNAAASIAANAILSNPRYTRQLMMMGA